MKLSEAFREILKGKFAFSDPTRKKAIQQIRQIVGDRIFSGRVPQNIELPWLDVVTVDIERENNSAAASACYQTTLQITTWAKERATCIRAAHACRQALGAMRINSPVVISSVVVDAEGSNEPDEILASDEFLFSYDLVFRVFHN